jgi:hypothetical protein
LQLPEPARATHDPFWALQVVGAVPLVLVILLGLDGLRYALLGPSPRERSIEIDVLIVAALNRFAAWMAAGCLAFLLWLASPHATNTTKRRLWQLQVAALVILLASAHWHGGAVLMLPR